MYKWSQLPVELVIQWALQDRCGSLCRLSLGVRKRSIGEAVRSFQGRCLSQVLKDDEKEIWKKWRHSM